MKLQGVYVATLTPFAKDGSVDLTAFKRHVQFLIENGVHGLVPCGTTGESPTLSLQERIALTEICLEEAEGKGVEVIVGCGGNHTALVLERILEAERVGCHGTLVVTPYYNRPTQSGLLAHYLHLADRCKKPIVLYHVPGRTAVPIALETVKALFEHPRIAAIKEASGQYGYWLGLAAIARASGKILMAGDDDGYAIIQALGGKGIISATANAIPATFVALHRLMTDGKWEEAFALQVRMVPYIKACFSETSPAPLKYALHRMGRMENTLRLPLVPVNEATQGLMDREYQTLIEGNRL